MAGFLKRDITRCSRPSSMNTKAISIEDWDAIDGFSPAVRDAEISIRSSINKLVQLIRAVKDQTLFATDDCIVPGPI